MDRKNQKFICKILSEILKPHGFKKKGVNWIKAQNDAVLCVNLQGSIYSKMGYINFYAWFPKIENKAVEEYSTKNWHAEFRPEYLFAGREKVYSLLKYDESEVDFECFEKEIRVLFFDAALSLLFELSSLDNLRKYAEKFANGEKIQIGFTAEVFDHFSLTIK